MEMPMLEARNSFVRLPASEPVTRPSLDTTKEEAVFVPTTEVYKQLRELPEEILAMAEAFIETFSEPNDKNQISPLNVSSLFQDFYSTVVDQMEQFLPGQARDTAPNGIQMVTYEEIALRKARREISAAQKEVWEDAVERIVTENLYEKIFPVKTSNDSSRDHLLARKMSGLRAMETSLAQLGVTEVDSLSIKDAVERAGMLLRSLVDCKSPCDKVDRIIAAHKSIVDGLSQNVENAQHSGADLILPCLIFTLVRHEPTKVVSNLNYIQRFRRSEAINGEASYCLVNLEAAVSFLENVDLKNFGDTEASSVLSQDTSPDPQQVAEKLEMFKDQSENEKLAVTPTLPQRAVNLLPRPGVLAASAVSTADQGIKSIGSTLENSYKFLFRRLEQKQDGAPKTLEEVRRLVGVSTPTSTHARSRSNTFSTAANNQELSMPVHADSGRSLSASLSRLPGVNMVRGFSGNSPKPSTPAPKAPSTAQISGPEPPKILDRYLGLTADSLRIRDVAELIESYKELANYIKSFRGE